MPNWVYNEVEVSASAELLRTYLTTSLSDDEQACEVLRFNLHRLYPEKF